jgi:beta-lactamase class A
MSIRNQNTHAMILSRREFLGGLICLGPACAGSRGKSVTATSKSMQFSVDEIESRVGGRIGVCAVATDTGATIAHRADERFALCSTFKWILAAAVLAKVDENQIALDQEIAFDAGKIIAHSPVVGRHAQQGHLNVEALARAAVVTSDNTAANLLLTQVGGPAGLTEFLRSHGDMTTRLDRNEPTLNTNLPGDPRDTTTPRATVATLQALLTTPALSIVNRERLIEWMVSSETGKNRLRAGLPQEWRVADKTGTGERGARNDVAIAWPPNRAPILIASYLSDSTAPPSPLDAAHAALARLIAHELSP